MIAYVDPPSGLKLVPETVEEQAILDEWSAQHGKPESIQRTMEGTVTGLHITFTNG